MAHSSLINPGAIRLYAGKNLKGPGAVKRRGARARSKPSCPVPLPPWPISGDQMDMGNVGAAHMGHRLFVEQELCSLHPAVAVEPALHHVIAQEIAQCEQTHALVVGHPGADYLAARPAKTAAEYSVVGCFIKSVSAEPSHRFHAVQVAQHI